MFYLCSNCSKINDLCYPQACKRQTRPITYTPPITLSTRHPPGCRLNNGLRSRCVHEVQGRRRCLVRALPRLGRIAARYSNGSFGRTIPHLRHGAGVAAFVPGMERGVSITKPSCSRLNHKIAEFAHERSIVNSCVAAPSASRNRTIYATISAARFCISARLRRSGGSAWRCRFLANGMSQNVAPQLRLEADRRV